MKRQLLAALLLPLLILAIPVAAEVTGVLTEDTDGTETFHPVEAAGGEGTCMLWGDFGNGDAYIEMMATDGVTGLPDADGTTYTDNVAIPLHAGSAHRRFRVQLENSVDPELNWACYGGNE